MFSRMGPFGPIVFCQKFPTVRLKNNALTLI